MRRADKLLEPQFGLRLELVELVAWPRPSRRLELESALVELEAMDPGRNVELVIGYVSAVRMPTALTESLGVARLGGRHMVLRSMTWAEEFDELERVLDLLSPDERNELSRERRVHREVAILLHEWAHTMGATHESLSASIMASIYHPQAVGFSPESVGIIEAWARCQPPALVGGRLAATRLGRLTTTAGHAAGTRCRHGAPGRGRGCFRPTCAPSASRAASQGHGPGGRTRPNSVPPGRWRRWRLARPRSRPAAGRRLPGCCWREKPTAWERRRWPNEPPGERGRRLGRRRSSLPTPSGSGGKSPCRWTDRSRPLVSRTMSGR